jgi:hypothetical protein
MRRHTERGADVAATIHICILRSVLQRGVTTPPPQDENILREKRINNKQSNTVVLVYVHKNE